MAFDEEYFHPEEETKGSSNKTLRGDAMNFTVHKGNLYVIHWQHYKLPNKYSISEGSKLRNVHGDVRKNISLDLLQYRIGILSLLMNKFHLCSSACSKTHTDLKYPE